MNKAIILSVITAAIQQCSRCLSQCINGRRELERRRKELHAGKMVAYLDNLETTNETLTRINKRVQ